MSLLLNTFETLPARNPEMKLLNIKQNIVEILNKNNILLIDFVNSLLFKFFSSLLCLKLTVYQI